MSISDQGKETSAMKRFRQVIFVGLVLSFILWGAVAFYFAFSIKDQAGNSMNPDLEKLHNAFYQTLNNQTRTLEHEIEAQGIAQLIPQVKSSQFYSKKLEIVLDKIMFSEGINILTVLSTDGKTIVRGSNPTDHGDMIYFHNYDNLNPSASKLQELITLAANGKTISSTELLPKILLNKEYDSVRLESGETRKFPLSEVSEMVYVDKDGNPLSVNGETRETRGLAQISVVPIRNNNETVAVLFGAKLLSRDTKILYNFHRVSDSGGYHPTIAVNGMRIATTLPLDGGPLKGRPALSTFLDSKTDPSLQSTLYDYQGNQVGTILLEEPPVKWALLPPPTSLQRRAAKNNLSSDLVINNQIKTAYDNANPPWIPLGYLVVALILGLFAALIVAATLKEVALAIGNSIKRKQYLKYFNGKESRFKTKSELIKLKQEANVLLRETKAPQNTCGFEANNISEEELTDFTSSLVGDTENATKSL